ncbi:MAG: apolipoprotein N-acyltransferase, partial [Betaproteobacteria bacterium]|nr:apolipoprotein N-acyltransferase [Betaproteobacteria bacterium]
MKHNVGVVPALLAAFAGALAVAGFAPYGFWPAPVLSLAVLMLLWRRARGRWAAAELGFLWGMGCFASGISWIEISLHDFGGMPRSLAILCILGFSALLSCFPALVGYLSTHFANRPKTRWLLAVPTLWTLSEWTRSWFLTGFPWLSLGYAQTPEGPLAGYAPVLGVFGVTLASVLLSGLLTALVTARRDSHSRIPLLLALVVLVGTGVQLHHVRWTRPSGPPISVNLLQGNIGQDQKFLAEFSDLTVQRYLNLLDNSSGHLIVMPESAFPIMRQQLPESTAESLERFGVDHDSDILV